MLYHPLVLEKIYACKPMMAGLLQIHHAEDDYGNKDEDE
jgi:hypothetical protein